MSGHSKWSTIKRKKGAKDAERGRIFTRLIKEITVAARHGGGDETSNPRLRTAVLAAKAANMPLKNVENAIKKGTGELPGVHYEEVTYEGYGPGGVAVFLECLTDNKNRTVAEIRHIFTRCNGSLGEHGSVAWMFDKVGVITVPAKNTTEDDLMMIVLDAGATDIEQEDESFIVKTDISSLEGVKAALEENGIKYSSAELTREPQTTIAVEGKQAEQVLKMMDMLEDNDDVQNLFSNFDIDDSVIEALNA